MFLCGIFNEDIGDIIQKVKGSGEYEICKTLGSAANRGVFPEVWAVDHERNNFLIKMPVLVRPDSMDVQYLILCNDKCYMFYDEGQCGYWCYFDKKYVPSSTCIGEVKKEIELAFSVYGRWGTGPDDEFGKAVNVTVPHFKGDR